MEPSRVMMAVAGLEYTDGRHGEPSGDMTANLGRMPTIEVDGQGSIGQSHAINFYVASTTNMLGSSPFEAAKCLEIQEHITEMKQAWYKMVPYGTEPTAEQLTAWFEGGASDVSGAAVRGTDRYLSWWLGRIEAGLSGQDGYAVGSKLSLADVLLHNALAEHLSEAESDKPEAARFPFNSKALMDASLARFPKISASIAKVTGNANVQKWLSTRGPQGF